MDGQELEQGKIIRNREDVRHRVLRLLAKEVHVAVLNTSAEKPRGHQEASHSLFFGLFLLLVCFDFIRLNDDKVVGQAASEPA